MSLLGMERVWVWVGKVLPWPRRVKGPKAMLVNGFTASWQQFGDKRGPAPEAYYW